MKKYIYLVIATFSLMFTSCDETEGVIYDGNQTLGYFDGNSATLEVIINSSSSIDVTIGVSTIATTDRTVVVSATESTTATTNQYSFDGNVTIPANSYFGTLTINAQDADDLTTTGVNLNLQIDEVEGGVGSKENFNVSIKKICPVSSEFFVGDYRMEVITPGVFGLPAFGTDGGTFTLEMGASSTERTFDGFYLDDGRFPRTFRFQLSCNKVVFPTFDTNVTCDTSDDINLVLGPAEAGMEGTYDPNDDSSFIINVTDNVDSDCGAIPSQTSYRFVKITN